MFKKIISVALCLCFFAHSFSLHSYAVETSITPASEYQETHDLINAITASLANQSAINNLLSQSKLSAHQGHGFAFELVNNLTDRIKLNNATIVGNDNAPNGPDRKIINRFTKDVTWIQDKCYKTANESIEACFENGEFRYYVNDKPMQIEVPKDQYEEAVQLMRKKIEAGQIKTVTDPDEANNIVKPSKYTYKQVQNLTKPLTVESLAYDAATGAITAGCAFGIGTVLCYAVNRIQGVERSAAIKEAAKESAQTGALVFVSSVLASQLTKTGVANAFKPAAEALAKKLGPKVAAEIIQVVGKEPVVPSTQKALLSKLTKIIQSSALISGTTSVVFAVPDAINMFQGRISKTQFVKNFVVTAVGIAAGTAGAIGGGVVANMLIPGVGTLPGELVGGILAGWGAGWIANKIADYITDDDSDKVYEWLQDAFSQQCDDYLVTEEEAQNICERFSEQLNDKMMKDIYQHRNEEDYIKNLLTPFFEEEVAKREKIALPTEEELRFEAKNEYRDLVFIH